MALALDIIKILIVTMFMGGNISAMDTPGDESHQKDDTFEPADNINDEYFAMAQYICQRPEPLQPPSEDVGLGRVRFTSRNGEFEGFWNNSSGLGRCNYVNGDNYEGEIRNHKKGKRGKYQFRNGDSYMGEWEDDMPHGKGTYMWSKGEMFQGMWNHGERHGEGEFYYANGKVVSGDWAHDALQTIRPIQEARN